MHCHVRRPLERGWGEDKSGSSPQNGRTNVPMTDLPKTPVSQAKASQTASCQPDSHQPAIQPMSSPSASQPDT